MFLNSTRLPHILKPTCYTSPEFFDREVASVLQPSWHVVASTAQMPRPGDFMTFELLGRPVQLRNVDGQYHAFSNVCIHRHCLLSSLACGHSDKLKCQYHGWEYHEDGRTGHIPEPKSFVPFDRETDRLAKFRLERRGQLLLMTLDDHAPPLSAQWDRQCAMLDVAFGDAWQFTHAWDTELAVNWKIPLENGIEGYHIPAVHPKTFKVAPTSERTTHVLSDHWTLYRTPNVAPSFAERMLFGLERLFLRGLGRTPSNSYTNYHLFPNVLISSSDMLSLCIVIEPVSVMRSRVRVRLFSYRGSRPNVLARSLCAIWSRLNRVLSQMVLNEDFAIYPAIQQGLLASEHPGCLGSIEERVHAFQQYVDRRCRGEVDGVSAERNGDALLEVSPPRASGAIPA